MEYSTVAVDKEATCGCVCSGCGRQFIDERLEGAGKTSTQNSLCWESGSWAEEEQGQACQSPGFSDHPQPEHQDCPNYLLTGGPSQRATMHVPGLEGKCLKTILQLPVQKFLNKETK